MNTHIRTLYTSIQSRVRGLTPVRMRELDHLTELCHQEREGEGESNQPCVILLVNIILIHAALGT